MEFGSQEQQEAEEKAEEKAAAEDTLAEVDLAEGGEVYVGLWISIFSPGRIPVYVGFSHCSCAWIWLRNRSRFLGARPRKRERSAVS